MVWFRHYLSQRWQIYVAILRHNVLSNCHDINGDSHITDPFVRGNHRWQVVLTKDQCCGAFVFCFVVSLNNLLDKQSSCPWLKTLWCQWHFTVLTTCHFKNVVRPQWKYFKNVNCLAAQVTLAITNFNFAIQRLKKEIKRNCRLQNIGHCVNENKKTPTTFGGCQQGSASNEPQMGCYLNI